jgi:endonuclease YncB( thermonuclease family)
MKRTVREPAVLILAVMVAACIEPTVEPGLPESQPPDIADAADIVDLDLDLVDARIERVIDGDSLIAILDGVEVEVRLEGINAPERDECLGDESRDHLEEVLDSGPVQIAGTEFDQFDRLLGIVTAGGLPVNVTQVADGLAIPLAAASDVDDLILAAEARARTSSVGIWNPESCGSGPLPDIAIIAVEPDPPGRDEEDLDSERVVIRNETDSVQDLSGWVLRDESTANRFEFPNGTAISAGGSIEIVVGCTPGPDRLTWCNDRPVWNNGGDTALLLDPDGRIVDLYRYRDEG